MLKLAPFFQIRLDDRLCCDLLLDGRRVELRDPRYVQLLSGLHRPADPEELVLRAATVFGLGREDACSLVGDLVRERILRDEDEEDPREESLKHWDERGWRDALTLHCVSRDIEFDDDGSLDPEQLHDELFGRLIDREAPPPFWREHHDVPRVELPPAGSMPGDRSLEELLLARRSNGKWTGAMLPIERLSTILRLANRETSRLRRIAESQWRSKPRTLLQSAFSALETYVFALGVEGLEPGIYHYDPCEGCLWLIRSGSFRQELAQMCAGQQRPSSAACAFAITAVFDRYMYRYRHPRAYRSLLVNVAELAQKYILLATACGQSTFLTPLLFDEVADALLGVEGHEEAVLEVVAIG